MHSSSSSELRTRPKIADAGKTLLFRKQNNASNVKLAGFPLRHSKYACRKVFGDCRISGDMNDDEDIVAALCIDMSFVKNLTIFCDFELDRSFDRYACNESSRPSSVKLFDVPNKTKTPINSN